MQLPDAAVSVPERVELPPASRDGKTYGMLVSHSIIALL